MKISSGYYAKQPLELCKANLIFYLLLTEEELYVSCRFCKGWGLNIWRKEFFLALQFVPIEAEMHWGDSVVEALLRCFPGLP